MTTYEQTGRTGQKRRTRNELVAAARVLMARGVTEPTVEEAAAEASISRTTAYRYFPNQRALLVAAHPEIDSLSMLPKDAGTDPEERLLSVVKRFTLMVLESEEQQRTMLRLSLEPGTTGPALPLRQGRAIGWFEEALAPLVPGLGEAAVHQLAIAVRAAVGIESLVWLIDVAGLSRDQAAEVMQWSAQALLRHALADGLYAERG